MNEFDLIQKYFAPLSPGGLDDDAAVLDIPEGQELVVTSDTLNEGVHFLPQTEAAYVAHKSLRANLSDLAAMGATPLAYQLNLAFADKANARWVESFASALQQDQDEFKIFCSGGDTTTTKGPLSISITAMGLVPEGKAITRSGARPGDALVLTGPVGDAHIGLHFLSFLSPHPRWMPDTGKKKFGEGAEGYFIERYYKPRPRLDLIAPIRTYAHAATDISDGLLADLGHICQTSAVGAQLNLGKQLFSPPAQKMAEQGLITPQELLSGGDDYELLLALPPEHLNDFLDRASGCVVIGQFTEGAPEVTVIDEEGESVDIKHTGWSHF